jgi:tRNA threonylcarbamoyladenosine biosynthesis protein TsaB
VLLLALDTCDSRGSVALLDGARTLSEVPHPAAEEYSSWLIPAIDQVLAQNGVSHRDLAGYAVASGPGSFTGVRVGLTTAKAWAEVHAKPVFPVSRLAILADCADKSGEFAATLIDAQRKQLFAALYRRASGAWKLVGEECVIDPSEFFEYALQTAGDSHMSWVSLDPELLTDSSFWQSRNPSTTPVVRVSPPLASSIGRHAVAHMHEGGTDALTLDANYVRRSDAEIFGKKAAGT